MQPKIYIIKIREDEIFKCIKWEKISGSKQYALCFLVRAFLCTEGTQSAVQGPASDYQH